MISKTVGLCNIAFLILDKVIPCMFQNKKHFKCAEHQKQGMFAVLTGAGVE